MEEKSAGTARRRAFSPRLFRAGVPASRKTPRRDDEGDARERKQHGVKLPARQPENRAHADVRLAEKFVRDAHGGVEQTRLAEHLPVRSAGLPPPPRKAATDAAGAETPFPPLP